MKMTTSFDVNDSWQLDLTWTKHSMADLRRLRSLSLQIPFESELMLFGTLPEPLPLARDEGT